MAGAKQLIEEIEAKLGDAVPDTGEPAELNKPERRLVRSAYSWTKATLDDEQIRASVLRHLLVHAASVPGGQPGLLCVGGGIVVGLLDLSGLRLDFALRFEGTRFRQRIVLKDTRLVSLELPGVQVPGIDADRLAIDHDFVMSEGFACDGPAWLRSASIGGDLNCIGATFTAGENQPSLQFDGAQVGGRLFMKSRFRANHGVYGRNARIARGVLCHRAEFLDELDMARASVGGKFSLREASVGEGLPLSSDARPSLRLNGAKIAAELDLHGTKFGGTRVAVRRATIDGSLVWGATFRCLASGGGDTRPAVDLTQTQARFLADDDLSTWDGVDVVLDGFKYDGIAIPSDPDWTRRQRRRLSFKRAWLWRRIEWLDQQPQGRWAPNPYDQVRSALQQSGEESAARDVAIARERARRSKGGLDWPGRVVNHIYGAALGFGYRPLRFFLTTVVAIFLFFLYYELAVDACDPMIGLNACGDFRVPDAHAGSFQALLFSADTFVPIDLGQSGDWIPTDTVLRYAIAFETTLGWLSTALLLGAVTGILRRD